MRRCDGSEMDLDGSKPQGQTGGGVTPGRPAESTSTRRLLIGACALGFVLMALAVL